MDRSRNITYEDILSSLNMTVVNGKIVIQRNVEKEKEKANIKPAVVNNVPAPEPVKLTALQQLQANLQHKKEKKLFLLDEIKSASSVKKMSLHNL